MYHSITFGDGSLYTSGSKQGQFKGTNTWEDWHLIPVTRPVIAAAKVFSKFVDIPGAHGTHDLSEYLTGHPIYKDRSGSLEFYTNSDDPEPWERLRARITNFLHGKKLKICLEDDPLFCWEGRFSFNEWKSEQICSKVVIDYVRSRSVLPTCRPRISCGICSDWIRLETAISSLTIMSAVL